MRETTKLHFFAARDGRRSPTVTASFHRILHEWGVRVVHDPAPQYTGGGVEALVDGLRGARDWRTGSWQGYRDSDFVAVVDLGEVQRIANAGASFLQDVRSWIWMPKQVEVEVSKDGTTFANVGVVDHTIAENSNDVLLADLVVEFDAVEARYVRITASNYGTIPSWHPGAGEGAWIFVDEIIIR